jgi:molybdenum cofactor biosynthesis enzyme MoaA
MQRHFHVTIQASRFGSLALYTEHRTYLIEVNEGVDPVVAAIERAHSEGLEHVRVNNVYEAIT